MADGYYISYYIHESSLNSVAGSLETVLDLLQRIIHHSIKEFKIVQERNPTKVNF
jgi:hypothetical protein